MVELGKALVGLGLLLLVVGVVKEGGHDGGWKGEPAKIRVERK